MGEKWGAEHATGAFKYMDGVSWKVVGVAGVLIFSILSCGTRGTVTPGAGLLEEPGMVRMCIGTYVGMKSLFVL